MEKLEDFVTPKVLRKLSTYTKGKQTNNNPWLYVRIIQKAFKNTKKNLVHVIWCVLNHSNAQAGFRVTGYIALR